jgi:DNA modification methylase
MAEKSKREYRATYKSAAEARATAGSVPVFCAYDKLVSPKDLTGNPRNPNKHPKERIKLLAHIIQSQGWRAPITVSNQSGFVVRGHGRLAAALSFGAELVPVDYQNYANNAEEWADLIADNRLAELAEIDNVTLADLITEMDTGEIPLILTGYTEDDIEGILAAIAGDGDAEGDGADETPDVPEIPMTRSGDLWRLGKHRLVCGSAADHAAVERLMGGNLAHMVFTDPPYGVSYESQSGKFGMIRNDNLTGDDLIAKLLIPAFKNLAEFTEHDAAFYIWRASAPRRDFEDAMTAAGLIEKQYIIWVKNNFQMGRADYHWGHEPCFYAQKAGQTARFFGDRTNQTVWRAALRKANGLETTITGGLVITDGAGGKIYIADKPSKGKKTRYIRAAEKDAILLCNESKASTAWEVSRETGIEHPTQKPVELAIRAIENSSRDGEIVLDLFGGSGSALIGAEMTGRAACLTEIDPKYCDVIVNRYARVTGDGGVCVRAGQSLPYSELKQRNGADNSRRQELR